jgi:hypothetical protein
LYRPIVLPVASEGVVRASKPGALSAVGVAVGSLRNGCSSSAAASNVSTRPRSS